jgi:hypothetical protein
VGGRSRFARIGASPGTVKLATLSGLNILTAQFRVQTYIDKLNSLGCTRRYTEVLNASALLVS